MKFLLITGFMFLLAGNAKSQSTEDSVKAVVNNLFSAMKTSDEAMLLSCFADSALLQTIATNKEGNRFIKNESIKAFAASIATAPKGALDERITFDMIKIDGSLASVWTPYTFYFSEKFSHCGVNSFQIVRTGKGWKIQYLIDTRRKQGCF